MTKSVSKKLTNKPAKKTGWKSYQSNKAYQKRITLALGALFLVGMLILAGKVVSFIGSLNAPFSSDGRRISIPWDGESVINLIIKSENINVLSFNPGSKSATILNIPDDTYMKVPFGYGSWPTRSIYQLGEGETLPKGAYLLSEVIKSEMSIPVDGYIFLNSHLSSESLEDLILSLRYHPIKTLKFFRNVRTNLSFVELINLVGKLWSIRSDKIKAVDLGKSQIAESILLPDGTRALGFDRVRLDQLIQKNFMDEKIADESLAVGIYNSTPKVGLANSVSRIVSNMGGRVIFTGNSQVKLKQTLVLGATSYTKKRLTAIFAPYCSEGSFWPFRLIQKPKCDTTTADDPEISSSRADIIVILGEDYSN